MLNEITARATQAALAVYDPDGRCASGPSLSTPAPATPGAPAWADMSETAKTDLRLTAYADVDETNAQIGVAVATGALEPDVVTVLTRIQNDLFDVGADVCRRAERSAWAAYAEHAEVMNLLAITYLNRLSDLLFILARYANREQGDVLWVPGGERGES